LISRAARGDADEFISSVIPEGRRQEVPLLAVAAQKALAKVNLPHHILTENWTVDPFGLQRLHNRILEKIAANEIEDLIPLSPHDAPKDLYPRIFNRLIQEVFDREDAFGALVANLAIPWMKGVPYPAILKSWISRQRKNEERKQKKAIAEGKAPPKPATVDSLIYKAFELIEDVVRFQFVQLGKAYHDLLLYSFRQTGHEDRIPDIYDFALALELGISTETGTAFVELGLSRIAASALSDLFPDSSLNTQQARSVLKALDVEANHLSPIIIAELERLRLREPVKD
jgi:hypothetical protein